MNTSVNTKYKCKIPASPHTFQVDIFGETRQNPISYIISCRDIEAQGLDVCVNKKQASKRDKRSVAILKQFKDEVGFVKG
jgi:hypothetical protein